VRFRNSAGDKGSQKSRNGVAKGGFLLKWLLTMRMIGRKEGLLFFIPDYMLDRDSGGALFMLRRAAADCRRSKPR